MTAFTKQVYPRRTHWRGAGDLFVVNESVASLFHSSIKQRMEMVLFWYPSWTNLN
jgi:hypothetical protein